MSQSKYKCLCSADFRKVIATFYLSLNPPLTYYLCLKETAFELPKLIEFSYEASLLIKIFLKKELLLIQDELAKLSLWGYGALLGLEKLKGTDLSNKAHF